MEPATSAWERLRSSSRIRQIPIPVPAGQAPGDGPRAEAAVDVVGPVSLPIRVGDREYAARWFVGKGVGYPGATGLQDEEVSVLQFGEPVRQGPPPRVRIHSACLTGDAFGSLRCDCGPQLDAAIQQIAEGAPGGLLIYMVGHEGRGIGLSSKAAAYLLQQDGMDAYEANRALGFPDDQRDFRLAVAVVREFIQDRPFDLLTNNPLKLKSLEAFGLAGATRRALVVGASKHNRRYLKAKRAHGHLLPA